MEIENYNKYLIYSDGRVWSKYTNKFLKPYLDNKGYYRVDLYKDRKKKYFSIHRLIAIHFIDNPNPEELKFVDHIDRNRINNALSNLHWVTALQNSNNQGTFKHNTSGHKNIKIHNTKYTSGWLFSKIVNTKLIEKYFKTKVLAIAYKIYIYRKYNLPLI
jgi:hypothetical protein